MKRPHDVFEHPDKAGLAEIRQAFFVDGADF
jgi:hypothetical protein